MLFKRQDIYHVNMEKGRTTLKLPKILSEMLAIKFNVQPRTREAHKIIRDWLQDKLNRDPVRIHVSQWVTAEAIAEVTDEKLRRKHQNWEYEKLVKETKLQ